MSPYDHPDGPLLHKPTKIRRATGPRRVGARILIRRSVLLRFFFANWTGPGALRIRKPQRRGNLGGRNSFYWLLGMPQDAPRRAQDAATFRHLLARPLDIDFASVWEANLDQLGLQNPSKIKQNP